MAVGKVTVSLDTTAWTFAELAASRAGVPAAVWISRAVRREAVRVGVGRVSGTAEIAAHETELHGAEDAVRAAG